MGLITINEVKRVTKLSENSIRRLMKEGKFPLPVNIGIKVTRWKELEINEWINNLQPKRFYKTNKFKICKCCKYCSKGGAK